MLLKKEKSAFFQIACCSLFRSSSIRSPVARYSGVPQETLVKSALAKCPVAPFSEVPQADPLVLLIQEPPQRKLVNSTLVEDPLLLLIQKFPRRG